MVINRFLLSVLLPVLLISCRQPATAPYVDQTAYYLLEDRTASLTPQEAWKLFEEGKFTLQSAHSYNPGFTRSCFWLVAKTFHSGTQPLHLEIGTPQINRIEFYTVVNRQPALQFVTGDYEYYESRPEPTLDFTFDLAYDQYYLVKADKRNEALQLTFNTLPSTILWHELSESSMIIGILTGVIVLMLLFGIYLSLMTQEKVYLFYVLYVASGWLYVLANLGYGYKYLWPESPWFASRARPVFTLVTIALSAQFIEHYTGKATRRWQQWTFRSMSYFSYLLGALFLIPFVELSGSEAGYILQGFIPVVVGLYIIVVLADLGERSWKGNRMAMFYLSAISLLFVLTTLQLLHYSGGMDVSGTFFETYGQGLGYVSESVILTFGLAYRFNNYRREREQLLVNITEQQVRYAKAIISTEENERRQIAGQLHDVAGSLLSAAKLNLSSVRERFMVPSEDSAKLMKAEEAVTSISEMLRNLSHALSPVMLDKVGIRQSVEKLVQLFNTSGKLTVELDVLGFSVHRKELDEKYMVIYGILYELINNVSRHAQATHALVQLIEHEDSMALVVEDNGKGMDMETLEFSQTHGLAAIRSKVHYLNGIIAFDHALPHGLIVTIEIPKTDAPKS